MEAFSSQKQHKDIRTTRACEGPIERTCRSIRRGWSSFSGCLWLRLMRPESWIWLWIHQQWDMLLFKHVIAANDTSHYKRATAPVPPTPC
jgi:hypothetical protein